MEHAETKEENFENIKIFVCGHQPFEVPAHELLLPIQVGTALSKERFPGVFHDDSGDNISAKNRSYCELTAQYWAWKNMEADYYGFFHYRRYLYPDINAKRPYRITWKATLKGLDYERFAELIRQYDVILPLKENLYYPIYEHYANSPYHYDRDLELITQIIKETTPKMAKVTDEYLSGTVCHFGNIYIMKKEVFHDYCAWLFPLLEEYDRRADTGNYSLQEKRVDGYLAERLLGVYIAFRKDALKILELPRIQFYSGKEYAERLILNAVLPPGTKSRSIIKRIYYGAVNCCRSGI